MSQRIAVVGSGVSGLTAAYLLARHHDVTIYESEPRLGGHAHTHDVPVGGGTVAVDSGFIVLNDRTYPHLQRLFGELGVATRPTEMSMSITDPRTGLAFAGGRGVSGFLAQPRRLADPRYLRTLAGVRRFHKTAAALLAATDDTDKTTFGEFVRDHGFSDDFVDLYAVPLVSCVWSSGRVDALDYPARYLFRFLDHHGMLSVGNSPQWMTVVGGSRTYVDAIAARIPDVRTGSPVRAIERHPDYVTIRTAQGVERHDRVVVATHADTALGLLVDVTPDEKDVLGAFRYSQNDTVLHRDLSLLPGPTRARASWNYRPGRDGRPVVTYWMNKLQGHDAGHPLLVTLNATDEIDPSLVVARMSYDHPIHDLVAVRAQPRLAEIASDTTVFAGAYHGWGFHEDGARSGVAAAAHFGVEW